MVYYVKEGITPPTRHTYVEKRNLRREELFGEESFEGSYSLLYHRNEPTRIKSVSEVAKKIPKFKIPIVHKLLNTAQMRKEGDFVSGRKVILGNGNVFLSISKPLRKMESLFRHGIRDQLIFARKGRGVLKSMMGEITFRAGDYIYVPKGTTYSIDYDISSEFLLIESRENIAIPQRYLNRYGQIKEGVPYYTRDIRHPILKERGGKKGNYEVYVDFDERYVLEERDTDPFDLEGWDGYHFPFAINVEDMMPIIGKVHQPPPVHETFTAKSFMVATFLPRKFDFHERAIPISYYHSNVDTDEFLYYASGNFMSRKGVKEGSVTLHVRGMIHGPQPGTIENAIGREGTDETAVMVESYDRIGISEEGCVGRYSKIYPC